MENLVQGDWLIHYAIGRVRQKRAEVASVIGTQIQLYIEDEPGLIGISAAEVTRWWELFLPSTAAVAPPPAWIRPGAIFYAEKVVQHRAILCSVRDGLVSYFESSPGFTDVFRLLPYDDFRVNWRLVQAPSAWDRIRSPAL